MFAVRRRSRVATVVGAVVLALTMAACGSGTSSTGTTDQSQVVVGIPSDVNSLDPANTLGSQDQELVLNLYDRLVNLKMHPGPDGTQVWDGLEVTPGLATSWDVAGPTITFHLRDDVTFPGSGNKMTANDVKWSFERLPAVGGNGKNQAGVAGLRDGNQIQVIDDHTVSITFTDPSGAPAQLPVSLPNLRFLQFGVIDSQVAKQHVTAEDPWASDWLSKNVAGTGPYTIESRQPGQQIVLKAVTPRWNGTDPAYKTVVLRITGDADPVGLMKTGVVDYVSTGVTGRQFDDLAANGFTVVNQQVADILRMDVSTETGPTADPRVRQAIAYATPYDQIISSAFSGRGQRAHTVLNPQDPFGTKDWDRYQTDLDKARALLAEAGTGPVTVKLWYNADVAYNEDTALLMQQSFAQAGITLDLQARPGSQLQTMWKGHINGGNPEMTGIYLSNATIWLDDPDTFMQQWATTQGASNWARYSDPEVDALQQQFRFSSDEAGRKAAYATIQGKIAESAHQIPIAVLGRTVAVSPDVTGVAFGPEPYARLEYLSPKPATS
ncbi:ABC transporter substrate-binding protein [Pseudonocardia kujensis]|uniref:ABC transporter substrate-binding protein n=1 Tax=Pseudonocardia kujensis TaxID=1128675 RepID=UPI001E582586|nr:ABC transporter substrate-binding protein [Pseudonocardia kujensis]MCE0764551.1 ABC transporter substrate-binding protein [Pseudonocardia kujensis]